MVMKISKNGKKAGKWVRNEYEKYADKLKAGYCIANLSISHFNGEIMDFIEKLEDGTNIIILECDLR